MVPLCQHSQELQIIQNKCLKIIMNRHWGYSTSMLHEEINFLIEFTLSLEMSICKLLLRMIAINFDL
jgi:hypothetical protein